MTARVSAPAVLVVAAGCALLTLRPVLLDASGARGAVPLVVAVFTALLIAGVVLPTPFWRELHASAARHARQNAMAVFAIGVAAFALGRLIGGGEAPHAFVAKLVVLNTMAAVAEEAFFRRLAYDALSAGGAVAAVLGSASLFALVHVTVYGWWVLPLDLAAGLVLSWQRWATDRWTVPAGTHVVANLFVVL